MSDTPKKGRVTSRQQKHDEEEAQKRVDAAVQTALERARVPRTVRGTPKGRVIMGRIVPVPCPLFPEVIDEDGTVHPQLVVYFRTSSLQKYVEGQFDMESETLEEQRLELWCKKMGYLAVKFEGWDFLAEGVDGTPGEPIPMPTLANWRDFIPLVGDDTPFTELGNWIVGEGFDEALEIAAKNSFVSQI